MGFLPDAQLSICTLSSSKTTFPQPGLPIPSPQNQQFSGGDHQRTRCLLAQPFSPLGNHPKNHRARPWGEKPTGGWEGEALWLSISSDLPEPEPLWQLLGPGWGQASGQPGLARNPRSSPGALPELPPAPPPSPSARGRAAGARREEGAGAEGARSATSSLIAAGIFTTAQMSF